MNKIAWRQSAYAICSFFLALFIIPGWNLFAKTNVTYLFGRRVQKPSVLAVLVFIFPGTTRESDLIWSLSDMFNQLMVIPNAIALLTLTGVVKKMLESRDK